MGDYTRNSLNCYCNVMGIDVSCHYSLVYNGENALTVTATTHVVIFHLTSATNKTVQYTTTPTHHGETPKNE
jgi:hypothetical protein